MLDQSLLETQPFSYDFAKGGGQLSKTQCCLDHYEERAKQDTTNITLYKYLILIYTLQKYKS